MQDIFFKGFLKLRVVSSRLSLKIFLNDEKKHESLYLLAKYTRATLNIGRVLFSKEKVCHSTLEYIIDFTDEGRQQQHHEN